MLVTLEFNKPKIADTLRECKKHLETSRLRELEDVYLQCAEQLIIQLENYLTRPVREFVTELKQGIYVGDIDYFWIKNNMRLDTLIAQQYFSDIGSMSYGYADNLEQILKFYGEYLDSTRKYIIVINSCNKYDSRRGDYIGNKIGRELIYYRIFEIIGGDYK